MNRRFFNQQNLTRRLRLLPVLFAMLLMPIGAWAEDYGFSIGGVAVGSGNIASFQNSGVSYDADSKTLTLENATIDRLCVNVTSGFIIDLKGKNTITASTDTAGIFSNINPTASLPITIKSSSTPVGSLTITPGSNSYMAYSGVSFTYQNGLSLIPDAQYLEAGQTAVVGVSYGLTVAGVQVTNANAAGIAGDGITGGTVTFTPASGGNSAVLTLSGATINGSIVKTASEAGDQLTINLVGTNTVNGQISFQSEDRMYLGDLSFTGSGSLNITSNDENGVIDGVSSVNTAEGLYIATDTPDPICYNGYYIAGISGSVMSLTVSTSVTYPIWVYNTSTTHYTQLTAAAPTFTTPSANVDENHEGSVSFTDNTLTLTNFLCKTTENSEFVFFVGKSLQNLIVNLVGESSIYGSGFHYTGNAELTFTTSNNGKLTYTSEPSYWSNYVTVNYENGLGYYGNVISTDWPRLQIGGTFVRGTTNTVGSYSNVSFDDTTNTLTLGGVTIGSQNSTVTDIDVYIKDLKVEISGDNTVYGRFFGMYEENGIRAGTITFKKKSGAETAKLTVSGYGEGGPVHNFVSSTLGEGLYISGKGTDSENEPVSIPTLSYYNGDYNDFDNPSNTVKEVTISENEPGTKLWIGGTAVTSEGDVFGDGKVSYNNHILSLNGATIEDIVSNVGTLTIDLTGSNNIRSISTTGNATALAFTGDGTLTLENSDGIITNFTSVDTGDFNLLSNSTPGIHWNATSKMFMAFDNSNIATELTLTKATVYQLWVGGVQVTEANRNGITGKTIGTFTSISGSVKFSPTGNVLTLTDASIGSPYYFCESPIISNLPNLEVNINKIDNNIAACILAGYENGFIDDGGGGVKSLNTDAALVFSTNYTSSSEAESPTMQIDCYAPIASGFKSISTSNQMIYKNTSNYYYVQRIAQPTMSLENGSLQLSDNNVIDLTPALQNSEVTLKYKITDASGTAGEEKTFVTTTVETINNPCTIEAWAEYQDQASDHVKGKYFSSAASPFKLVYGGSAEVLTLSPAIETSDGIKISSVTEGANATFDATTQKFTPVSTGTSNRTVTLTYTGEGGEYEEGNTVILNESFNVQVDVAPPAPTITPNGGPLAYNQTITLSLPEGCDADINYKWDDGTEQTYTAPIEVQTGTLTAWAIRTEDPANLLSDEVTATFTTLLNPELSFSVVENVVWMGTTEDAPTLKYSASMTAAPTVTWSSDHPEIATVDETTGVVTPVAVSATKATITATFAGDDTYAPATASYKVEVAKGMNYLSVKYKDKDIPLAKVRVTKGKTLNIKENYNLICPAELVSSLTWTPDASTIATAADGVVSGVSCGNTRIVVAFAGNDNYAADTYEFYVDVAPLAPTIELETGTYLSTHAPITITKENIANTTISYTWDDLTGNNDAEWKNYTDAGVTIQEGTLSARVGYYDAENYNTIYSDTVSVAYTVIIDPELQFIQNDEPVDAAVYTIGATNNLELPVLDNTYGVAVTYESSNTDVATVATDGTVTVVGIGTATITATSAATSEYAAGEASYTLTVNRQLNVSFSTSNEWATYYGSENLAKPEGLKAYQVTAVEGATVTISEIGYIPANTAVLLQNVSNNNVWTNIAASAYTGATSTFENNKLIGTASAVDVSTITGGTVYILVNNMFRRSTSGSIPANRGYLVVATSSNAPQLSISIGDENTTAISNTDFTDNTDKAGEWYSIDGVKLNGQPQKPGLYIKNGKKVFINKK